MADNTGGDAPSSPAGRRPSGAMAGRTSSDRDAPRVRFSQDIDKAAAFASSNQRPGTPNLTIDTRGARENLGEAIRSPSNLNPTKTTSPLSPTSPRTRDRGYSLRRTLFARSINNQADNSPIELEEAGPSREHERSARRLEQGKRKSRDSIINVSPVAEHSLGISSAEFGEGSSTSKSTKGNDKKTFGTISLPNYDVWARKRTQDSNLVRKIKSCKELIIKTIQKSREIPPFKDGRHIDLDASRKATLIDERTGREYIGNTIRSSRYTLWSFLPRQLLFQFSKLANAYFLLISILQMIPGLSTTGTYTTIAPLLVFVAISMAKEGYDDFRRYKLDKVENNREVCTLFVLNVCVYLGHSS
jgi:phospholipid-translocating ATPase